MNAGEGGSLKGQQSCQKTTLTKQYFFTITCSPKRWFFPFFLMVQIRDTFKNKCTTKILDLAFSVSAFCVCEVELIVLCHFSFLIPFLLPLRPQFCLSDVINDNPRGDNFTFDDPELYSVLVQTGFCLFCCCFLFCFLEPTDINSFKIYLCVLPTERKTHLDGTSLYTEARNKKTSPRGANGQAFCQRIFLKRQVGFRTWRSMGS